MNTPSTENLGYNTTTTKWQSGGVSFTYIEPATTQDWGTALDQLEKSGSLYAVARGLHHAMKSCQPELVRQRFFIVRHRLNEALQACPEEDEPEKREYRTASGILDEIAEEMHLAA